MQTRFIGLGLAILMMAGACGGSDSTDTSASPLSTEPATSSPTDSSTATTEGPPPTTGAPAPTTTTTAAPDPLLTAALAAGGVYSGSWTNTTFGSTGDAGLTMTVTEDGDVSMVWDLGGFVFGASDPDGETQVLNVSRLAGGTTLATGLFGDLDIGVSEDFGTLTLDAENVPTAGIQAFRATLTWSDDGTITGTYVVEFDGGGTPAEGTFEMTRG